ncbi:DUF3618 domain-containing protein [Arthrobacter sp. NPDC093139]|uniref:DUF3618 domain-containing protein n=1 Tax=Arthrobacter sp. NPDC093139 TaxID=3363945 RepID=UPI0037FEB61D
MSEKPDAIRTDIEETRTRLGTDVDAVAGKVTPSNIVHRQTSAVADAPHQAALKTQGNPLAAGLIAFGAGLLVSSLIPPSRKEREAADALKTAAEPVTTQLTGAAKEVAEGLKEPAQEAMENVKTTASDAVQHVKDEGQAAASDVKSSASDAKDHVQNT